jgi:hypothetical protein
MKALPCASDRLHKGALKKIVMMLKNKKSHKINCGILTTDSKNIPKIKERQRKKSVFEGVI